MMQFQGYDESVMQFGEMASEKIRLEQIPECEWEKELYSVWVQFIHKVLVKEELCGCLKYGEDSNECFLFYDRNRQKEIGGHICSFKHILEDFKQAWDEFYRQ